MKVAGVTWRGSAAPVTYTSPAKAKSEALRRLAHRYPVRMKLRGQEYGQPVRAPSAPAELDRLMRRAQDGDAVWIQVVSSGRILVIRVGTLHLVAPAPVPSPHSTQAAGIWRYVFNEVQRLEVRLGRDLRVITMGIYNCRRIANSSTWSQHAWAHALDFVVQAYDTHARTWQTDIEATDRLTASLRSKAFCSEVLWRGVPNHFPGHAHASGDPKKYGTPPCAS